MTTKARENASSAKFPTNSKPWFFDFAVKFGVPGLLAVWFSFQLIGILKDALRETSRQNSHELVELRRAVERLGDREAETATATGKTVELLRVLIRQVGGGEEP